MRTSNQKRNFIMTKTTITLFLVFISGCKLLPMMGDELEATITAPTKTDIVLESAEYKWEFGSYNDSEFISHSQGVAIRKNGEQTFLLPHEGKKYPITIPDNTLLNVIGYFPNGADFAHVALIGGKNVIPGVTRIGVGLQPDLTNKNPFAKKRYFSTAFFIEKNGVWYISYQDGALKNFHFNYVFEGPTIENKIHMKRSTLVSYQNGNLTFKCDGQYVTTSNVSVDSYAHTCDMPIKITQITYDGIYFRWTYFDSIPFL